MSVFDHQPRRRPSFLIRESGIFSSCGVGEKRGEIGWEGPLLYP